MASKRGTYFIFFYLRRSHLKSFTEAAVATHWGGSLWLLFRIAFGRHDVYEALRSTRHDVLSCWIPLAREPVITLITDRVCVDFRTRLMSHELS